ncbi:MAG: putative hemolysin [Patescibacteria group bacterium]
MNTKYFLLPSIVFMALVAAGCGSQKPTTNDQASTSTPIVQPKTDDKLAQDTALSNPATIYCLQQGGKFTMQKSLDGSTEGLCTLSDNITCDVWAYYKGDCPAGSKRKVETSTSTKTTTTTPMAKEEVNNGSGTQEPADNSQDSEDSKLELSAEPGEPGEVVVRWKMNGLKSDAFLVMLSGNPNISGYGKYNHELNNPDSRSFTWTDLVAGRTYYFKVCTYKDKECIEMSNETQAIAQ